MRVEDEDRRFRANGGLRVAGEVGQIKDSCC